MSPLFHCTHTHGTSQTYVNLVLYILCHHIPIGYNIHGVSKTVVKDAQSTCKLNKNICGVCNKKVKRLAKQMVACDKWYHYVCVGVTEEEVEAMDFKCPDGCRN